MDVDPKALDDVPANADELIDEQVPLDLDEEEDE